MLACLVKQATTATRWQLPSSTLTSTLMSMLATNGTITVLATSILILGKQPTKTLIYPEVIKLSRLLVYTF